MYAPDFNIPLPDGSSVPLLFLNWTYRKYTERIGSEYENLIEQIATGRALKVTHLPVLLRTAAEAHARFNRREFNVTEIEIDEWIEAIGFLYITNPTFLELYKVFVSRLMKISPEKFDLVWQKANEQTTDGEDGAKEAPKKSKPDMAPVLPIGSESGVKAVGS